MATRILFQVPQASTLLITFHDYEDNSCNKRSAVTIRSDLADSERLSVAESLAVLQPLTITTGQMGRTGNRWSLRPALSND